MKPMAPQRAGLAPDLSLALLEEIDSARHRFEQLLSSLRISSPPLSEPVRRSEELLAALERLKWAVERYTRSTE